MPPGEVLLETGEVYGTGENWNGQLGLGHQDRPRCRWLLEWFGGQEQPREMSKMKLNGTARAMDAGGEHSLILMVTWPLYERCVW